MSCARRVLLPAWLQCGAGVWAVGCPAWLKSSIGCIKLSGPSCIGFDFCGLRFECLMVLENTSVEEKEGLEMGPFIKGR